MVDRKNILSPCKAAKASTSPKPNQCSLPESGTEPQRHYEELLATLQPNSHVPVSPSTDSNAASNDTSTFLPPIHRLPPEALRAIFREVYSQLPTPKMSRLSRSHVQRVGKQ
ncbi:hypothetical protein M422DRAFT_254312 [Sphaerobolus stellatus SS14]|uniref:Uncharacterized protein n=1 Tax=Sphaerobolus stellatus (strain SS14) TaxID=990650 RepID=A0A0C9VLD1_SPHS4|nr:hypothetical protein M422DRAFT_254312 [Sphaerobolus stellatus SS14]